MRLFSAHGQNLVIGILLKHSLMVKILKSVNPKGSYAHLTIGVWESMKWRNRPSKSVVYHWVNGQLGEKSSIYTT